MSKDNDFKSEKLIVILIASKNNFHKLKISVICFQFTLFVSFFASSIFATTHITHYSVDNGLSENHVLCMLQDDNGAMWFGTHDGLNKFDGYTFRSYKGNVFHKYKLLNTRVNTILKDKNQFLWLITNDNRAYRFDPTKDEFTPFPQSMAGYQNYNKTINRISILPDGSVWLFNFDSGALDNCFRIIQKNRAAEPSIQFFSTEDKSLPAGKLIHVFIDESYNTRLLCEKGIGYIAKGDSKVSWFNTEGMISGTENQNDIYLGSASGGLFKLIDKNKVMLLFQIPEKSKLTNIIKLSDNKLFLFTNSNSYYIFDIQTAKIQKFTCSELQNSIIYDCYKDRFENIWIDSNLGRKQVYFDSRANKFVILNIEINAYINTTGIKFHVFENSRNETWIQTRIYGLFRFNAEKQTLETIPTSHPYEKSLSQIVHTAYFDKQGNLWLGTYLQGIDKVVTQNTDFNFTKPEQMDGFSAKNEIRSLFQDSQGYIWAGSKNGGLYLYDNKFNLKGYVGCEGVVNKGNSFEFGIYRIFEDSKGFIWIATKGNGLYRLNRKPQNSGFKVLQLKHNVADNFSLSSNDVYCLFEDNKQQIWVGTFGGGVNILEQNGDNIKCIHAGNLLKNFPVEAARIRCITADRSGNIHLGTTQGLFVAKENNADYKQLKFHRYYHDLQNANSLSGNDVHSILPIAKNLMYVSTIGGNVDVVSGNLQIQSKVYFAALKTNDQHPIKSVYTLTETAQGKIWMSTQTNILCYNPRKKTVDVYKPFSMEKYFFSEAASCLTQNGEIIYGTSHGMVSFLPEKIRKSTYVPAMIFTNLQIFNKIVQAGEDDSPIELNLNDVEMLTLTHKQSTFSVEYAALDYSNPDEIQYAYKLDGVDKDWNYAGNQRTATYVNVPKGNYTFHIRSTNSDGVWVENERILQIERLPSFWESGWAYLLYFFILLLLSATVAYILFVIYRLRNEVAIEQRISNAKLRFFTDISHELRTPLTLIISPIEKMLGDTKITGNNREELEIVNKNASRMLRLINQILDFRKIQSDKMKLLVEQTDIVTYTREICLNFSKTAEDKNIRLNIINQTSEPYLWIDKDKFEKILYNLLSNAFKFSNADTDVDILIFEDVDRLIITIKDQGTGIPKDRLKTLFTRFESFSSKNFLGGTGIGLSLTKDLVELHKASIEVESEAGKGTSFQVSFRKGREHFDSSTEFILNDTESVENQSVPDIQPQTENQATITDEKHSILVAEDNNELRHYLAKNLAEKYTVYEAKNGKEAFRMAQIYLPDFIISDIVMPEMDGIELSKAIKSDINTSHIPFILLTAKADMDTRLRAMELRIDDYITKPFSYTYLEARIDNLLNIRTQLQTYYKNTFTNGVIAITKPQMNNADEVFLQKLVQHMEENYSDSDLNIDILANLTGTSRSSFYKKLKNLTGLAPVDFIREFRMQKAAQFIEAGESNISQISYNVGIIDTKYFSRCFRQKFGLNPSDYRRKMTKKEE